MLRSTHLITLTALALVACQPGNQPRPFAGRGGRSLDNPPRYGDSNRYVDPIAPAPIPGGVVTPTVDPLAPIPGTPPVTVPGTPGVDPGLALTPPGTTPPAPTTPGVTPPAVPGTTPAPTKPPTTTTPPAAAPGEVPFARSVPGKPGYVFSPKDPKKIISVDGLRPGSKAKDPETGEIFRVPYQ